MDTVVCDSLKNPNDSEIIRNLDNWINHQINHTNSTDLDLSLVNIISDCHSGKTLYNVFQVMVARWQ